MKKTALICAIFFFLFMPSSVLDYGGEGGSPPGYYGNPHGRPSLTCEFITKHLPFNRTIKVSSCKVERFDDHIGDHNDDFNHRLAAFFNRLQNGSR